MRSTRVLKDGADMKFCAIFLQTAGKPVCSDEK
jgi:hypothetical protein